MINKLIKTEEDYDLVLSRIEDLMDAEANTAEAEELELLATLVELYEDEHYAMDTPEPIDAIKFRMEQLGLNQQGLVPFIEMKLKGIRRIIMCGQEQLQIVRSLTPKRS